MNLKNISIAICIISAVLFTAACLSIQKQGCPEKLDQMNRDSYGFQWCGDDIYLVKGEGIPKAGLKDIEKRKASSYEAAKLQAQYFVLEKFKGGCIGGACGIGLDQDPGYMAYMREIERITKAGVVIDFRYDDSEGCTVLFKVSRPGLRKIAERCYLE